MTVAAGLAPDQIESSRTNGPLFPLRAMSAERAAEYRSAREAFEKEPHHPKFIAWHPDVPFSAIPAGGEILTEWIAPAPSTLENSCLERDLGPEAAACLDEQLVRQHGDRCRRTI